MGDLPAVAFVSEDQRFGGLDVVGAAVAGGLEKASVLAPGHAPVRRNADVEIAQFFERCAEDSGHWHRIADGALERVRTRYNWALYAERMMTLSRIYGFWKYATNLERAETRRYLEMFYGLQYRPLAAQVPS